MRIVILYHPNSEHARTVEVFARDFKHTENKQAELVSLETKEGADLATLYDITSYPAVLTIRSDGQLSKHWQGDQLPLMSEVAAYAS